MLRVGLVLVMMAAGGCVRALRATGPAPLTVERITAHVPPSVPDRAGWARELADALAVNELPVDEVHVCAVLAVIEQESGYQPDPAVAGLPTIARRQLMDRASELGVVGRAVVREVLDMKAPGAALTFGQRLERVRTEADLDRLYRDILAEQRRRHPVAYTAADLAASLFSTEDLSGRNPVTTAGSMQVSVRFAEERARELGRDPATVRDVLYTRSGGLLYGTARLFAGAADQDMLYRFADYNAGLFASRNAALQQQVNELTGASLALDGDLLAYGPYREDTHSARAILGIPGTSLQDLREEKSQALEKTPTWRAVKSAWEATFGKAPPYARLPDVKLSSPKLSRTRSTAWFARSVHRRYTACLARA